MSEKKTYSIRELENLSGIPAHTIRTWERRYGLLSPVRDAGNTRCYAREVVGYLRQVGALLKQGHRISNLARKSPAEIHEMVRDIEPPLPDDLTAALCQALREYQVSRVESLVRCQCKNDGFDKALEERFAPFLDQMSVLLISGVLEPVHLQIFSNILRQRLFAEIDSFHTARDAETWVLLHESSAHQSVYADIIRYLMRRNDKQVVSIGLPGMKNLQTMLSQSQVKGICFILDGDLNDQQVNEILESDSIYRGNTLVFTPGKTLNFLNNSQFQQISVIKGLSDAFRYWKNTSR